jgi:hypothetical protein
VAASTFLYVTAVCLGRPLVSLANSDDSYTPCTSYEYVCSNDLIQRISPRRDGNVLLTLQSVFASKLISGNVRRLTGLPTLSNDEVLALLVL